MFRAYLKPEQPPGITPTRRPATVASTFSSARNFRTSAAACSVRVSVTGAVFCVVPIWLYPSVTAQLREAGPRSQRRRPSPCRETARTPNWCPMQLTIIDWLVIGAYFALNIGIGFYYKSRASVSTSEFFLSGRNVPWWLAGTSMVATTFAADTPLVVTGFVARNGIAGNWIWWCFLA